MYIEYNNVHAVIVCKDILVYTEVQRNIKTFNPIIVHQLCIIFIFKFHINVVKLG
jgi:hypothetical protein